MDLVSAVRNLIEFSDIDPSLIGRIVRTVQANLPKGLGTYIGGGDRGHAWRIGPYVLKLTTDKDEAYAASQIIKQSHPNVAVYHNIVQFDRLPFFMVIQDFGGRPIKDKTLIGFLDHLPASTDEVIALLQKEVKASNDPYDQILRGMQFLRDQGLRFVDLHGDNVVQSDNTYKIIDVGMSGSAEPHNIRKLKLLEYKLDLAFTDAIEIVPLVSD
jgi:serine/threonine protein kinase